MGVCTRISVCIQVETRLKRLPVFKAAQKYQNITELLLIMIREWPTRLVETKERTVFQNKQKTFGLGPTNWAENVLGHLE
jgi:hypothetical protein